MSVYSKILSFLLAVTLAGCATSKVDALAPADKKEEIVLTEKLSTVHFGVGFSHIRWDHIALPGTYVAKRKTSDGVLFFGSDRPIVRITKVFNNGKPHALIGGIFVPDDASKPPSFFYIFEGNTFYPVDDIDSYIAQREKARLAATNSQSNIGPMMATSYATQGALGLANVTPLQGGVGGALGGVIVDGIIEMSKGNVEYVPITKDPIVEAKIRAARHAVAAPTTSSVSAN